MTQPFNQSTNEEVADGLRYIAAHTVDPRDEELLCEAADRLTALAAAARQGGDVKQAPGEAPQSGGASRNAQPLPPLPPSKDSDNHG